MRGGKYCPQARTPSTARRRSSADSSEWKTHDEVEWLTRLKRDNPFAFQMYKRNFYHRTQWGRLDPAAIARYLELAWPKPREE